MVNVTPRCKSTVLLLGSLEIESKDIIRPCPFLNLQSQAGYWVFFETYKAERFHVGVNVGNDPFIHENAHLFALCT